MAIDDDIPEYVGADKTTRAEPPKSRKGMPPVVDPSHVPSGAVYHPPVAGAAHPKAARKRVALALDVAEANLTAAQMEISASYNALQIAEREEAHALGELTRILPRPTAEEVHRAHLARETAAKVARVAQGLSPTAKPAPTNNKSPLDVAAANRPRAAAHLPSGSLRSAVARRIV